MFRGFKPLGFRWFKVRLQGLGGLSVQGFRVRGFKLRPLGFKG